MSVRISITEILCLNLVRPETLKEKCSLKDKSFIQKKLFKRVEVTNHLIHINSQRKTENKAVINYII